MKFSEDGRDDDLKGGAIKSSAKREEINVATGIPSKVQLQEAPMQLDARSTSRTTSIPSLVQPPVTDVDVRQPLQQQDVIRGGGIHPLTKRSNGKGSHYDSDEVRHHMVHSLSRHPPLLKAYLNSSVI